MGDGVGSLRGASEKQNRTLEAESALDTCNPDPHCGWEADRCHCCYNGGCDYEDLCRCGDAAVSASASHSENFDEGASEDATDTNSTGMLDTFTSWWCEPVGGVCGGPRKWPKKCCGNAKCERLLGGDGTKKCVEQHPVHQQCVHSHGECGGPGRRTLPCCAPWLSCKAP